MPLVKFLKSVFGGSRSSKPTEQTPSPGERTTPAAKRGKRKQAKPTIPTAAAQQPLAAESAKPVPQKRSVLALVSGGPHGSLCRMIKKLNVQSVLEVGVGDGSRATAVLETLGKSRTEGGLQYIAIDQFELAGGPVTLRQFHQQIRSVGVKPTLIPMPVQQGLTRVLHTFGQVDLVLLGDDESAPDDDLLARITGPESTILRFDGQTWQQIPRKIQDPRRAA